ncbi:MAG: DUF1592 domain-containing protein [Myxococcota bacterium]|nr:DUF1592 domain-containing protein [Myxococcota bacterium]
MALLVGMGCESEPTDRPSAVAGGGTSAASSMPSTEGGSRETMPESTIAGEGPDAPVGNRPADDPGSVAGTMGEDLAASTAAPRGENRNGDAANDGQSSTPPGAGSTGVAGRPTSESGSGGTRAESDEEGGTMPVEPASGGHQTPDNDATPMAGQLDEEPPRAGDAVAAGPVTPMGGEADAIDPDTPMAGQTQADVDDTPVAGQSGQNPVDGPMAGRSDPDESMSGTGGIDPSDDDLVPMGGSAAPNDGGDDECLDANDYFTTYAWPEIFNSNTYGCVGCHVQGGPGQNTRFVLVGDDQPNWAVRNMESIRTVVDARIDGRPLILMKPLGEPVIQHGGGRVLGVDSPQYTHLEELVYRMTGQLDFCGAPTGPDPRQPVAAEDEGCDELQPGRRQLRRLSHIEYQNTVRDLLGIDIDAAGAFVADSVVDGFANHPDALFVGGLLAEQYRQMAESLAERVDLTALSPCALSAADIECGHEFIAQFGLKAFRRPLTSGEIATYRNLFRAAVADECYEQGMRWVITAMLQSPNFLYRSELGIRAGDEFALTSYEIASQLSYLFWQTMPDEILMNLASTGELLEAATIRQQVTRLLSDTRSLAMANDFVGRWLHTDQLMRVIRDSIIYKDLYFETRESMLKETEFLVDEIWQANRPFTDLFTSEYSWLDERLGQYYGIERGDGPPNEAGFVRVRVEDLRPGGVLTHGSFLTTHASPTTSSPIMRGVTVQERLLCVHLDPPPVGLVVMPPAIDPEASTREAFAQHSSDAACRGCHNLIDPVGFGFERFDGIGRWRADDNGQPVDSSGELTRREGEPTPFDGVGELSDLLASDWQVTHCYARQWLRFGFGETEGLNAECYNDHLANTLVANQSNMTGVVQALTETPHFRRRTGEATESAPPWTALAPTGPNVAVEADDPAIAPLDLPALTCGIAPPMDDGEVIDDPRLTLALQSEDSWSTGYCRQYTLTNNSDAPVVGWAVQIEVPGPIGTAYNVERDRDDGLVTFRPIGNWARTIAPGAPFGFGFCGTK